MRDPRYPLDPDESLAPTMVALHKAHQAGERLMERLVAEHDLTPAQFDVLSTLGDTEGLPFKQLSQKALISGGTLTPVLNRLEAKGLVQRLPHPSDKRQLILRLTPEGQARYEASFLPTIDEVQARVGGLSATEQAELTGLLVRLERLLRGEPRP